MENSFAIYSPWDQVFRKFMIFVKLYNLLKKRRRFHNGYISTLLRVKYTEAGPRKMGHERGHEIQLDFELVAVAVARCRNTEFLHNHFLLF